MHRLRVGLLLFGSGLAALVYQVACIREFRLIFGASTAATAAVLAVFIGGLGAGGLILGARADRSSRPLRLYGALELGAAALAAISPLLLWLVRVIYVGLGGSASLGLFGGTCLRLLLGALVLAGPTLLMGGAMPAAVAAVEVDEDVGRRNLALIYGLNTLGAVTGCLLANFVLLELLGTRKALWSATLLGAAVAMLALACWALIASIVVLPAALAAGVQFPVLIALLGRGRRAVRRGSFFISACWRPAPLRRTCTERPPSGVPWPVVPCAQSP